jgi:N6-L-threonylcarbamoyladenine synthase
VLGFETSCDETSCAVVEVGRKVISNVVFSQIIDHQKYGGVFPELASRRHVEKIVDVYKNALTQANLTLKEIDVVAVTVQPGLVGSLLVGVNFAKGLALYAKKPLVAVDHLKGHVASNYITHSGLKPPFLCLVVSGGHTQIINVVDYVQHEVMGRTMDDAAGEVLDKVGRVLGLQYPAGVAIDALAKTGNRKRYKLPRPQVKSSDLDFSFSGLKTAALNVIQCEQLKVGINIPDMAASFQGAVVDVLLEKLSIAMREKNAARFCLAGGVCANSELRTKAAAWADCCGFESFFPAFEFCGDNAAMVAAQGYYEFNAGNIACWDLNPLL